MLFSKVHLHGNVTEGIFETVFEEVWSFFQGFTCMEIRQKEFLEMGFLRGVVLDQGFSVYWQKVQF